jgi:hypothetical protein
MAGPILRGNGCMEHACDQSPGDGDSGGSVTTTATKTARTDLQPVQEDRTGPWYFGAVAVGAVLMVIAAIQQPFNQNELRQIAPYGSDSFAEITGGTRQPPLAPLIGSAFQHLFGQGQLQQRLEPVLAGIGLLVVTALLLRRLRLGHAGVIGLWVMATAPMVVRHAAYTRPYMLPMFFMVLFVYCAQGWIDDRRRGWLVGAAVSAVALPLSRVPEALVFLAASIGLLGLMALRRKFSWNQALPLITILAGALLLVAYPLYRTLASQAGDKVLDTSPAGIIARFDTGLTELLTYTVPLMARWLPWWPITLLVIVASLLLPTSRRLLLRWWWFWALLAAPVVFLLAYHFLNPYPFWIRHYRPRYGAFFAPVYICMVVAVAVWLQTVAPFRRWARLGLPALALCLVVGQLPATGRLLVHDQVADYDDVAQVLTEELPDDAIVLYDVPNPVGVWGQPFSSYPRYMGETPYVGKVNSMARFPRKVPEHGPVYVLMLHGQCSWSVDCNLQVRPRRNVHAPGWTVKKEFDWFTLYEPVQSADGRQGVIDAMTSFWKALGPRLGYSEVFVAATLLKKAGRPAQGAALIHRMYEQASPDVAARIREAAQAGHLNPFPPERMRKAAERDP